MHRGVILRGKYLRTPFWVIFLKVRVWKKSSDWGLMYIFFFFDSWQPGRVFGYLVCPPTFATQPLFEYSCSFQNFKNFFDSSFE